MSFDDDITLHDMKAKLEKLISSGDFPEASELAQEIATYQRDAIRREVFNKEEVLMERRRIKV